MNDENNIKSSQVSTDESNNNLKDEKNQDKGSNEQETKKSGSKNNKGQTKSEKASEKKDDSIDFDEYLKGLLDGRIGLKKIGYSYLLAELHKRLGDSKNKTQSIKVNSDLLNVVCGVMREEFGIKNQEEQIETALLLVLYVAR